jgi:hypothetical protein
LIRQGVFRFLGLKNQHKNSKKIKLIGRFISRLFGFSVKSDDPLVLFVGELKDIHFATLWQGGFYPFAQGIHLRATGAEAHVHTELAHLKAKIKQSIAKARGSFSLSLFNHWQIKHHHHPHEPIS